MGGYPTRTSPDCATPAIQQRSVIRCSAWCSSPNGKPVTGFVFLAKDAAAFRGSPCRSSTARSPCGADSARPVSDSDTPSGSASRSHYDRTSPNFTTPSAIDRSRDLGDRTARCSKELECLSSKLGSLLRWTTHRGQGLPENRVSNESGQLQGEIRSSS